MSARITEAMVEAYKHAFGDYLDKVTRGLVLPPTTDVGWHATKYALELVVAALSTEPGEAEGMVLVPRDPTPEMLGAWYRYKSGHHWPGEPPPPDTSDVGAYAAMLAAAPLPEREGQDG